MDILDYIQYMPSLWAQTALWIIIPFKMRFMSREPEGLISDATLTCQDDSKKDTRTNNAENSGRLVCQG